MRILNNLSALHAFTSLDKTNKALPKTITALSTGLRINSSADDAAGFAISERMRSQIGGLNVASRNAQDGVSLLQTAEGALEQTNSMLQRMRELAIEASNDSLTSQDREYLQLEVEELRDQIDRIASTTQFNRKRILDGSSGAIWSSDDLSLKARINRGLVTVDEFGQKVNHEGNFRIEVRAESGQPQIQKSNIMPVADYGVEVEMQKLTEPITQTVYEIDYVTETITETVTELVRVPTVETITTIEEVPHIIRINEGIDSINETYGDGWKFENGSLVITGSGTYDIRGTQGANPASTPNIIVKAGAAAKIFLTDVNIDKSRTGSSSGTPGQAAFQIEVGASAEVLLTNSNSLKSGAGRAGLEVPDGAKLKIVSADGKGKITGNLKAEGGYYGAGIGGFGIPYSPNKGRAGSIDILGGTIEAINPEGVGIGGGESNGPDGGGTINIYGGRITAQGGSYWAGIGSAYYPSPSNMGYSDNTSITIYNVESLSAYGGNNGGAGIGGSMYSSAGNIRVNKRLLDENRINAVAGGTGAERIGWGYGGNLGDNNISLDEYFEDDTVYDVPDRPTI